MDRRYNLRSTSASKTESFRSRHNGASSSSTLDGGTRYSDRSSPVRDDAEGDGSSSFTTRSQSVQRALYQTMEEDGESSASEHERHEKHSTYGRVVEEDRVSDEEEEEDVDESDNDDDREQHVVTSRRRAPRRQHAQSRIQRIIQLVSRSMKLVLRNAFMMCNVLWLLAPLGCFVVAVVVPSYLTRAIGYADMMVNFTTPNGTFAGVQESKNLKSIVQGIVDVKLYAIQEELQGLRQLVSTQRDELDALRLLHESLREAHDDQLRKLSLSDSKSPLSVHIERVLSKHSEQMWSKMGSESSTYKEKVDMTQRQTQHLGQKVESQQKEIEALRRFASEQSTPGSGSKTSYEMELSLRKQVDEWKSSFAKEMEGKVKTAEERITSSFLAEKRLLFESLESLNNLDLDDPGLISVIQDAVAEADSRRRGRVDHAALVNGGVVVYTMSDLLSRPTQLESMVNGVSQWLLHSSTEEFTSRSLCRYPSTLMLTLASFGDNPAWLSRHNGRPETALSETMEAGSCWAMKGSGGRLSVRFSKPIVPDSVSIDHVPEHTAADFSSAPRNFQIWGLQVDQLHQRVDKVNLGGFTFSRTGGTPQTFKLVSNTDSKPAFDGVMMEISSNYGHSEYTCLYRLRVHGQPA